MKFVAGQRVCYRCPAGPPWLKEQMTMASLATSGLYMRLSIKGGDGQNRPISGRVLGVSTEADESIWVIFRPDNWALAEGVWPRGFVVNAIDLVAYAEDAPILEGIYTNGTGREWSEEEVRTMIENRPP